MTKHPYQSFTPNVTIVQLNYRQNRLRLQLRAHEDKLLHMPIVGIIESGYIEPRISAYSFLRIDTEVIKINITVSTGSLGVVVGSWMASRTTLQHHFL